MPRGNPSPKLAITVDAKVHEKIFAAAARDGVSVSAWMTNAASEALQRRAGLASVVEWEKHHGSFSAEDMDNTRSPSTQYAHRELTLRASRRQPGQYKRIDLKE